MFLPKRNRQQFEAAVRQHSTELYRFAYWKLRDRAGAEDVVQEAFARAWKSWDGLRAPAAARAWLYTIVRNEVARAGERARPEQADEEAIERLVAEGQSSPDGKAEMENLLEALPETYREPLLLQVLGGFSCAEIGAMLSISEAAVMKRVSRARETLRELQAPAPAKPAMVL
jgi:RNA polymerase sigma-70 factor, ECF subfamily